MKLLTELVRVPSRGGIDDDGPVLNHMAGWLGDHGLSAQRLHDAHGRTVALMSEVTGTAPGPRYVLDACLDTAPFGDETLWVHHATSGVVVDGWLHGRGAADSKAAAAVFAHLLARLKRGGRRWRGSVVLLLDVDEHTGRFGGAKAFVEPPGGDGPLGGPVDGVMIGYPGIDKIVIGGRGVFRARVHLNGISGHSGSSSAATANAVTKAAELIGALHRVELPGPEGGYPGAKLTVTAISGGEGYSAVPDVCTLNIDIRLTPAFDADAAARVLSGHVTAVDAVWPGTPPSHIERVLTWPPFQLPEASPLRAALERAALDVGFAPQIKVAGPSNIGNYLAKHAIPATAGFGVDYVGLHATDERVRLDSLPQVADVYDRALATLLT